MTLLISEHISTARKDYNCDACYFVLPELSDIRHFCKLTFSEWRSIVNAKRNRGKILKGQKYLKQCVKDSDNSVRTFRAIPEIHAICVKHEFYPED